MCTLRFMMKWGLALLLVVSMPVMADVAPVESIPSENMPPMPDYRASVGKAQNNTAEQQTATAATQNNAAPAPNNSSAENNTVIPEDNASAAQPLSSEERVDRLEQQMANLAQMNLPQQINELRQELQQLNGRLQVQQHDIQVLSNQQRSFYEDLNRQIQQVQGGTAAAGQPIAKNASSPSVSEVADANMDDSKAYRAAFDLLMKKQYPAAIHAFRAYLDNHARGAFVANAHYWLGEIYIRQDNVKQAEKSFKALVHQFPKSNKVPDAKLKLAVIHIKMGKVERGRRELQAIKRQYPSSTAAQLASIQLQRMD